jgi:hypothetical protein
MLHELLESSGKCLDAGEDFLPDDFLGDEVAPDLHLIGPGSISRCVVNLIAGMDCESVVHLRMPVRSILVHHQIIG